ncbi:MAG TPA: OsmC family protein [Anaerolineae bacterium]|nr:OsmC family protein [Anaerolineae bacterium]
MAEFVRRGEAVWQGDLRGGRGTYSTESGAVTDEPYRFATRFENEPGSNPEELIAAAHAACYSMAFANVLAKKGYDPQRIETEAVCTLTTGEGGSRITAMKLTVRGQVPGMDEATFRQMAHEGDQNCPVSNLLRSGLEISVEAQLI